MGRGAGRRDAGRSRVRGARGRPGIDRIDADVSPTADIDGSERRQLNWTWPSQDGDSVQEPLINVGGF